MPSNFKRQILKYKKPHKSSQRYQETTGAIFSSLMWLRTFDSTGLLSMLESEASDWIKCCGAKNKLCCSSLPALKRHFFRFKNAKPNFLLLESFSTLTTKKVSVCAWVWVGESASVWRRKSFGMTERVRVSDPENKNLCACLLLCGWVVEHTGE